MAGRQYKQVFLFIFLMSSLFSFCVAINKYTKEANLPELTEDLKTLEKPFRLAKVNLVWSKAQKVRNLNFNYLSNSIIARFSTIDYYLHSF